MRIMAIDIGEKRIGAAVSDELGWTAQPLETVTAAKTIERTVARVADLAKTAKAEKIIFGLPLNMDGSEGPAAKAARDFAQKVSKATGLPVEPWDERLSTVSAERVLLQADLSRKKRKKKIDQVAAQIILQAYLDSLAYKKG